MFQNIQNSDKKKIIAYTLNIEEDNNNNIEKKKVYSLYTEQQ